MAGRFVIYGPGGVGGVIASGLARAGHSVAVVARGNHLKAIQSQGLEFRHHGGTEHIELEAVERPGRLDLQADDTVILAVKSQDTRDALEALASEAPPELSIVCAQNGVDNERQALRHFADVSAMCVYLPGTHLEPGVVMAFGSPFFGILDLGRYPSGRSVAAERVAAALSGSGFRSEVNEAIMRFKYAKLRANARNALDAACGWDARGSELGLRASTEALATFRAAGIDVATGDEEAARREGFSTKPLAGESRFGSSSWQSLARRTGSIEADYLNGEVVMLGRLYDVETPVNETLRKLANRMARARSAPGSVPLSEVEAMVTALEA
jgi:2-dehydropantoate 2-reductase